MEGRKKPNQPKKKKPPHQKNPTKKTATKKEWRSIICRKADKMVVIAPLQNLKSSLSLSTKHPGS